MGQAQRVMPTLRHWSIPGVGIWRRADSAASVQDLAHCFMSVQAHPSSGPTAVSSVSSNGPTLCGACAEATHQFQVGQVVPRLDLTRASPGPNTHVCNTSARLPNAGKRSTSNKVVLSSGRCVTCAESGLTCRLLCWEALCARWSVCGGSLSARPARKGCAGARRMALQWQCGAACSEPK